MAKLNFIAALIVFMLAGNYCNAQYAQAERNDTTYIFPKTKFDTTVALSALGRGNSTIKGVAFTKPKTSFGYKAPLAKKIYANRISVLIFPVTPYLLEFLDLKKDEKPKKLKFVYMSNQAYYYHYEAVTNSTGEFTIPNLKPGKYYLEGILPWSTSGTYNQYSGSGYDNYGRVDYYTPKAYNVSHYDKLTEFVEIKNDGDVVDVKLK